MLDVWAGSSLFCSGAPDSRCPKKLGAGETETVGYSGAKLAALRVWLSTQQTTALHVSVGGRVVFEYGDVKQVSKVASVRKSVLAMLFGNYVEKGPINPRKTVEELGLEDVQPYITVLPGLGLVFAHKVDFDQDGGRHITPSEFHTILQMVIDSACGGPCK